MSALENVLEEIREIRGSLR